MAWHKVAKTTDMKDGGAQIIDISGQSIALFNLKGKFYATDNHCLHRGGPLADGHIEGSIVTCPWHAWQFDVKSGECLTMKGSKLKCYPTKIENSEIHIEI